MTRIYIIFAFVGWCFAAGVLLALFIWKLRTRKEKRGFDVVRKEENST